MKSLLFLLFLHLSVNAQVPSWHEIKKTPHGAKMLKIVEALIEYDSDFQEFPPNLISLVTNGNLKDSDLCLPNADKSISVPSYFPGHSTTSRPDTVILTSPSADSKYTIVVRIDGSISGIPNQQKAEQGGAGQPATRSESKSGGSNKPQPESEGRSR